MSYIALARKWRPQAFTELLGQDHLVNALQNSLTNQRVHHAYLFTGTRGVGKTSVARLLAKSLNCETGITPNPCLKCDACIAFNEGRFIDLIEIDGASKTKVEDTRELLDNVQYSPTVGRFKIYLIDEVHMLSQHSFNALLKTLEEPPQHVKFLLATTDPEKLPITVLSRCLQFSLKHVHEDTLNTHLKNILKAEKIEYKDDAIALLARAAKGSVRDALSLLDQAIVGCANGINLKDVQSLLGYTKQNYAKQIIQALSNANPEQLIQISRNINSEGGLFIHTVDQILTLLHKIAVQQLIPSEANELDTDITVLSEQLSPEDTQLLYQIALKGRDDILLAPTPIIGFEILLLRMHTFTPVKQQNPIIQTKQTSFQDVVQEQRLADDSTEAYSSRTEQTTISQKAQAKNSSDKSKTTISPQVTTPRDIPREWHMLVPLLNLKGLALNAAENAQLNSYENNTYKLVTDKAHETLFTNSVITTIEKALSAVYAKPTKLIVQTGELPNPSPAKIKQNIADERLKSASESLEQDVFFKRLQDEFSAELVKNSIASLKDDT